ncbi:DUF1592 domain-containing protein [Neorhodopirellula pilleata]|nr:DUF1592 domain-containing protein [Neorhodopirellula pilleata]
MRKPKPCRRARWCSSGDEALSDFTLLLSAVLGMFFTTTLSCADDAWQRTLASALEHHCVHCHGQDGHAESDVNLVSMDAETLSTQVELVQQLIDVLDQHEMPPADEPDLNSDVRRSLVEGLKTIRDQSAAPRSYVKTPIRRMNRFQYNNAVQDLFELRCIVFTLPERMMRAHRGYFDPSTGKMPDVVYVGSRPLGKSQMIEPRLEGVAAFPQDLRAEHGFDNRGDHLSLSPLLMQSFLNLGDSITDSRDFNSINVGIWNSFFRSPKVRLEREPLRAEIQARVNPFLRRAFRGRVDTPTSDRYVGFALSQMDQGADFTEAMKRVAAAALASPRFLYLYDTNHGANELNNQDGRTYRIDDHEFASRLSFFLWGSSPDIALLDLADAGRLSQPDVVDEQVDRMFRDNNLKRFCDSFPSQWLQLERIISSVPDREKFDDFYFAKYRKSMHMMMEPLLLFETILIENRPIIELIDPSFTYRSGLLESFYGDLATVSESDRTKPSGEVGIATFTRRPITDRRTGGVITNAAVMTMTSGPHRTQPITRGAWIATAIFNDPPDPPPADVPPLAEKPAADEADMTLRERLAIHRQRADCRGCHEQIDPLGFALENFDPVGRWRDLYDNDREIDVSGQLFRKHDFVDVIQFKDAIVAEQRRFARAFTEHLLSFALARSLGPADQIAIEKIVRDAEQDDYRIQDLIKHIIHSEPFQTATYSSGTST